MIRLIADISVTPKRLSGWRNSVVSIVFLSVEDVIEICRDQIQRYGGSFGVRDQGLLESAVAMPQAAFGGDYLHEDSSSMAAAYLFHLTMNHPFIDGNKRTGAMAAFVFLDLNGIELTATPDAFADFVLRIASGQAEKSDAIAFFRDNSRPVVK